jgi:hypothetical protein
MEPGKLDLEMYIGTQFGPLIITCLDTNGDPVNIRGYTVEAEARTSSTATASFDVGATITNGDAGEITLKKLHTETATLVPGRPRWDLILVTPAGVRIGPILAGTVKVTQPITR